MLGHHWRALPTCGDHSTARSVSSRHQMNVTVFGATGAIGQQVVDQLRSNGHAVTAYVRNPGKVPADWRNDVTWWLARSPTPRRSTARLPAPGAVVSALGPEHGPQGHRSTAD